MITWPPVPVKLTEDESYAWRQTLVELEDDALNSVRILAALERSIDPDETPEAYGAAVCELADAKVWLSITQGILPKYNH